jgi:[ribosomal protein S18]-alanine N-acetyltransferase
MLQEQQYQLNVEETFIELGDLDALSRIEERAYPYPWTPGNLRDSMAAGHLFPALKRGNILLAYSILMPVLDEIHLLNLTVDPDFQRQGWGKEMLLLSLRTSSTVLSGQSILLEVRPSNTAALHLYDAHGFKAVGVRKAYYPADNGREDALILRRSLP